MELNTWDLKAVLLNKCIKVQKNNKRCWGPPSYPRKQDEISYPKEKAVIGEDCGITVVFYSHREVLSSVPKSKKHFVPIKPGILKQITKTV